MTTAGAPYEQFVVHALIHFGLVQANQKRSADYAWHALQAQLKTKTGARDFAHGRCQKSVAFAVKDSVINVSTTPEESAFPTESANRAKERRKAREADLLETGGEEAVKLSRKRRAQAQEEHFDDCGCSI